MSQVQHLCNQNLHGKRDFHHPKSTFAPFSDQSEISFAYSWTSADDTILQ